MGSELKDLFNDLQDEFDQFKGYDSNQMNVTEIIDMLSGKISMHLKSLF